MWMLGYQIFLQHGGIPNVLQDRHIDLRIRLQPRVAGKLKKMDQGDRKDRRADQEPSHLGGVLSSCCLVKTRLGLSASDFENASRASSLRCSLRRARPSHRYVSGGCLLSAMA